MCQRLRDIGIRRTGELSVNLVVPSVRTCFRERLKLHTKEHPKAHSCECTRDSDTERTLLIAIGEIRKDQGHCSVVSRESDSAWRKDVPTKPHANGPTLTSWVFVALKPKPLTMVGRNRASPNSMQPSMNRAIKRMITCGEVSARNISLMLNLSMEEVGWSTASRLRKTL